MTMSAALFRQAILSRRQANVASVRLFPAGTASAFARTSNRASFTSTTKKPNLLESAASWIVQHKAKAIVCTVLATPAAALIQGAYLLGRFRLQHGDAPVPIVPSHGLVAVKSHVQQVLPKVIQQWRDEVVNKKTKEAAPLVDNNDLEMAVKPLRLLVIGDSLAAGVGTAESCTPVLPKSIAAALSRTFHGRPVQWTCLGEPGASTGWIVHELEQQNGNQKKKKEEAASTDRDKESSPFHVFRDWPSLKQDAEWDDWWHITRLDIAKHWFGFDATDFGKYDVAVVLAGPNDFKMALLPFLFKSKANSPTKESFTTELLRAVEAVAENSKVELKRVRTLAKKSIDNVRTSVENALNLPVSTDDASTASPDGEEAEKEPLEADNEPKQPPSRDITPPQVDRPLIVLPSLPAKVLPVLRPAPVRWFAPPILGIMDGIKSRLAKKYPHAVLFVEAPRDSQLVEFEMSKMVESKDLITLSAVPPADCRQILNVMQEYYKGEMNSTETANPMSPGESLFSVDKVHPNDKGYEFWGQYIADAIVDEWRSTGKEGKR